MGKVAVVFWSGTGNTEAMADVIVEAAGAAKIECESFDAAKVAEYDAIAFGCPAMGAEELEDTIVLPMWDAVKGALSGKNIALFGSYGWGDGEWMRNWEEDAKNAGANLVCESVTCLETPDDEANENLKKLAAALANA